MRDPEHPVCPSSARKVASSKPRTLLPALLVVAMGASTLPPPAPPPPEVPGPSWFFGSVKQALAEAGRRETLVFLDFAPDW